MFDMKVEEWLRKILKKHGVKQAELARQLSEATGRDIDRSIVNKMLSGKRRVEAGELAAIERIIGVSFGKNEPTVPLVGYVGAGAETHLFAEGQGPFDMIQAPDGSTEKTVAAEVRGVSLGPAFDGWYIFYNEVRDPPTPDLIGRLCIVGLRDGRVLVKILRAGHLKDRYTLESNTGELPIYDADVVWAERVRQMTSK